MNTADEPISGQLVQSHASFIDDFQSRGKRLDAIKFYLFTVQVDTGEAADNGGRMPSLMNQSRAS